MRYLLPTLIVLAGCIPSTMMMPQTSTQSPITPASTVKTSSKSKTELTPPPKPASEPTQLATHQIEVRRLEVPYDVAWGAAAQAMFSLGYSIDFTDKTSGILTGSRMAGVKAFEEGTKWTQQVGRERQKQWEEEMELARKEHEKKYKEWQRQQETESTTRSAMSMIPYVGTAFAFMPSKTPEAPKLELPEAPSMDDLPSLEHPKSLQVTMRLKPLDKKSTEIRFKMQVNGEPAWDPATIDKLWVTTEREAMIEEGPVPASVAKTDTAPQAPSSASPSPSPEAKETKTAETMTPPPKGRHNRTKSEKTETKMTQATTLSSPEVIYIKEPAITLWDRSGTQPLQIATLSKGTKLTILGQEDKWCHVKTEDGREGWVASELTSSQP